MFLLQNYLINKIGNYCSNDGDNIENEIHTSLPIWRSDIETKEFFMKCIKDRLDCRTF